jgi:hypothetical protein
MRNFLIIIAVLSGFALVLALALASEQQATIPDYEVEGAEYSYMEMVAQLNEKTWVYRVEYKGEVCYHTVGYLHGYTVAIDCLQPEKPCEQDCNNYPLPFSGRPISYGK